MISINPDLHIVPRYTPPWSEDNRPYVVVYGKTAAAARIVYPDGQTVSADQMGFPSHSPTLKLSVSGIDGRSRKVRISEEGGDGKNLLDSGITWACVDEACDVYAVGGYLKGDKERKLPSLTVSTDPVHMLRL